MFFFRDRRRYSDGEIALAELHPGEAEPELGFGREYTFRITPAGSRREAGQISLRLGESEGVYYFGHIGYHIDPPYRGKHWAEKACRLLVPLMREQGLESVVITCDLDNEASRRTCERLGCVAERVVPVPAWLRKKYEVSAAKRRFVWRIG